MNEVVIIDAVRTPIGRYGGALKDVRPDDLGAAVINALVERNPNLPVEEIDDVIFGNANGAGEDNRNVARMSLLLAGLPETIAGTTINRLCGSGLDAISVGARAILSGEEEIIIAGGTESMTRAPYVMAKPNNSFPRGNMELFDTTIGWRFINPKLHYLHGTDTMPETAENVAKRFHISRSAQDGFAALSQEKTKNAMEQGKFDDEIIPIHVKDRKGNEVIIDTDEHPRPGTSVEKLSTLNPLFPEGTVTAGNASGINDGASAVLLMSKKRADELGLQPIAKYVGAAVAGVEPSVMGIGPIDSTMKLMHRTGLTINDFDLIELNEAFAAQSIACIEGLGIDIDKVNVNGGAIALGHPLGASGARILTTLVHEMKRRGSKRGLATMCIGVGQGISLTVENIDEL